MNTEALRRAHARALEELRALTDEIRDLPSNASQARVDEARTALDAAQTEVDRTSANLRDAERVQEARVRFTARPAGGGFESIGATTADDDAADFRAFIRTGEQRASMSTTDAAGGYLIPNPIVESMVEKLKKVDPIMGRATIFQMDVGNTSLEIPVQSALGAVSWVGETDARPETNSPTFDSVTLTAYEAYCNWMATQTMLDSIDGIESWISDELMKTLLSAAGERYATGTGTAQIKGVFAHTSSGYTVVQSGAADALANTAFSTAFYTLPAQFHPNAVWIMAPATLGAVSQFAWPNLTDTPLVQFRQDGTPTIMGKPVLLSDSAPAIGNGAHPVFFGDVAEAYAIGIHRNVTLLRDPYTNKPYVGFYAILRVGGVPRDNQAAVLIKSDNA